MSPILDLQRRLVEVGRIRLGMKKVSQNGKSYPARLEQFRLTSRDRQRLDAAAALYGGEVKKWGEEWELFTETDVLPVAVVPGQALNQSYELWGQKDLRGGKKSAVICLRRCDGVTEALTGGACLCDGEDEMACKPTTRLSVVLTEVPGLGVWRCEAHGWNAAMELAGGVQLLESLVAVGRPVRARLRLDKREKKTETETRNFVVPVIDIDHTLGQVLDAIGAGGPGGAPAIEAAGPAPLAPARKFTPVPAPAIEAGSAAASVSEQIAQPLAKSRRSNGAEPIRATGRRARARAEVVEAGTAAASTGGGPVPDGGASAGPPPGSSDGGEPTGPDPARSVLEPGDVVESESDSGTASPPSDVSPTATARARHIAIAGREIGIEKDEHRHAFISLVTDGRASSGKQLDDVDFGLVQECIGRVKDGRLRLVHEVDGGLRLDEVAEPTTGAGSDDEAFWSADRWREFVKAHKVTQVAALRHARAVAEELGVEPPAGFAEWTDGRVSAAVRKWVEGREAAA